MYDPDLSKVRFTGPLAKFASGWREVLVAEGYAASSAAVKLQLAAHLSRWLQENKFEAWDLTEPVIKAFLVERRATYPESTDCFGVFLGVLSTKCSSFRGKWGLSRVQFHQKEEHLASASFPYPGRRVSFLRRVQSRVPGRAGAGDAFGRDRGPAVVG